jgi:hypothetical protein
MGALTDLRVFGIQMRSAFQRDVAWVKDESYTLSSAVRSGFWQEEAYVKDAVANLRSNLLLIDDQILQKYVITQWMSEFVQELYREELQSRSDTIARDCIGADTSNLMCVGSSSLNLVDLGFSAFNPLTYAKAACNSYVTMLLKIEALTPEEAEDWHSRIKTVFLIKELIKLSKLAKELAEVAKDLKTAKRTLDGKIDKRFKVYKSGIKTRDEAGKESIESIVSQVNERNKDP